MQAPNLDADGASASAAIRELSISPTYFAREANRYLALLRNWYLERLRAGDDEGVYHATHAARVVERAVCVHSSARSLAIVRARSQSDTARAVDISTTKEYLLGVQTRLTTALMNRDVAVLEQICEGADVAMTSLAYPDQLFPDMEPRAEAAVLLEERAATVDAGMGSSEFQGNFAAGMEHLATPDLSVDERKGGARSKRFSLRALSRKDRAVLILYLVMCVCAIVAVAFITRQFIMGIINPDSFLRSEIHTALPMPVVTICLSRTGVPHSRLQVFNFSDATGKSHRGADPQGDYFSRREPVFDDAVERFWHKERDEDCDKVVGDFFPFPTRSLNELAAGTKTTTCRPCYRFGHKRPVISNSTAFESSSFISLFTDNYALECLQQPEGLTSHSIEFLHNRVATNLADTKSMVNFNILGRSDNGTMDALTKAEIKKLNGQQLCNIFYFGLFPKTLRKMSASNSQIRYLYDGNAWKFAGTGPEFVPPPKRVLHTDLFPLVSVQMFVTHNETIRNGTLKGEKDMVLLGPNTQTFVALRSVTVYDEPRYDVSTSTSNFFDADVIPLFGYWLNYRILYNYNRFITEQFYKASTYPFAEYAVDFTGYLSLFTGASIFSVFLLPILYSLKHKQRNRLRNENPEAYLLRKYRKNFGLRKMSALHHDLENENETRSVQLPGYNV